MGTEYEMKAFFDLIINTLQLHQKIAANPEIQEAFSKAIADIKTIRDGNTPEN